MDIKKFLINLLTLLSTPIYLICGLFVLIFYLAFKVGDKSIRLVRWMDRSYEIRLQENIQHVV